MYVRYIIKNGGRIKGEGKHQGQARTQASDEKPQGPGKGLEEAKNRSVPHPGKRVWVCGRDFKPRSAEPQKTRNPNKNKWVANQENNKKDFFFKIEKWPL